MKDITVKEYINLTDAERLPYDTLLSALQPKALIEIDINNLTYDEVKIINRKLNNIKTYQDVLNVLSKAYKISEPDLFEYSIVRYFELKKHLINFFVNLLKREQRLLSNSGTDEALWQAAGGEKLNEFGDVLPLSQLAKIYGGCPFDWGSKKYIEIVYLLRMNNVQSKVENEFQQLRSKQK